MLKCCGSPTRIASKPRSTQNDAQWRRHGTADVTVFVSPEFGAGVAPGKGDVCMAARGGARGSVAGVQRDGGSGGNGNASEGYGVHGRVKSRDLGMMMEIREALSVGVGVKLCSLAIEGVARRSNKGNKDLSTR